MRKLVVKALFMGAVFIALSSISYSQTPTKSTAEKVLNSTAKTGVIVVGKTAKYTWKATKFTAGKVVRPLIVKSAPKAGKFALRQSGNVVKSTIPIVKKFAVTYLKMRFSP